MKRNTIFKLYALCVVFLLTSIAFVSISNARESDPPSNWAQLLHRVWIEELDITEFEDPFFEIYAEFTSNVSYDIPLTIIHNLIYPDGTIEQQHWYQGILYGRETIACFIFCMYTTNQCGKYTWEVTVIEDLNGALLAQRSITWEREPV